MNQGNKWESYISISSIGWTKQTIFCSDCQILILSGNLFYDSINLKPLESFKQQNSAVYRSNKAWFTKNEVTVDTFHQALHL